jgi:hypothetical protein
VAHPSFDSVFREVPLRNCGLAVLVGYTMLTSTAVPLSKFGKSVSPSFRNPMLRTAGSPPPGIPKRGKSDFPKGRATRPVQQGRVCSLAAAFEQSVRETSANPLNPVTRVWSGFQMMSFVVTPVVASNLGLKGTCPGTFIEELYQLC